MFTVTSLTKQFGGRTVLSNVSFTVNRRETLGVIGANGSGKTTLLRILAGELEPEAGTIQRPIGDVLGYLRQGWADTAGQTAGALHPAAFDDEPPMGSGGDSIAEIAASLAAATEPRIIAELEDALAMAIDALGSREPARPPAPLTKTLRAIGLRAIGADTPTDVLSGGELTKLGLLALVASRPSSLLLDEPTNHLDADGIAWVEEYIRSFRGAVVVVSHDRALLDAVCTHILELDATDGTAELFTGSYSEFAAEKARREAEAWERYRRQQREERQVKRTIAAIESRARNIENHSIDFYVRKRAAKVARQSVNLKARIEREAQSEEHVDRPERRAQGFHGRFQSLDGGASMLLSADQLTLALGGHELFRGLTFAIRRGERTVVAGPNGAGKTTLLKAIVGEHAVAAGRLALSGSARVGYLNQVDDPSEEDARMTPVDVLRRARPMSEGEALNFLHRFLFGPGSSRTPIGRLSYGERRRLALARLVLTEVNLLLLDEPTNHLDLPSREAFEAALAEFEGGALIVTHDRYFTEQYADDVITLGHPAP